MRFLIAGLVAAGVACAGVGTGTRAGGSDSGTAADRAEVIAAVERLFDAMRTRDTAAIRAAMHPGATLVSISPADGATPQRLRYTPVSQFVALIGRETEVLDERMWNPRVDVTGDMAALWAPYDIRIGDRLGHCGHDAVHLARTDDGWKIVGITYTVITTGCAAR